MDHEQIESFPHRAGALGESMEAGGAGSGGAEEARALSTYRGQGAFGERGPFIARADLETPSFPPCYIWPRRTADALSPTAAQVNPIFSTALEVQDFCRREEWRFCFIGAVAVQRWGEPRLTLDVDLTVLTGFGSEAAYVDRLLERFSARRPDAREFALQYRVVLLSSGSSGVSIDVSLGAMPFEERIVSRASDFVIQPGTSLVTCGAEDLIVLKAFANREKDWLDIEGVLFRQGKRLDEPNIWRELEPLLELKEEPEIGDRLKRLIERCR